MMEFYLPELIETAKELGRLSENYKSSGDEKLLPSVQESNQKSFKTDAETFDRLDLQMSAISRKENRAKSL